MKNILLILFLFVNFGMTAQETIHDVLSKYNNGSIPYISVELLRAEMNQSNVLFLDTREKQEYDVSKIEGAIYVGYSDFSEENLSGIVSDKNQLIVVYCSLGVRSEKIGEKLKKAGYTNVKNLFGGIFEWKNKGFLVFDSGGNETEKVHAYSKQWGKWLLKGEKIY